MPSSSKAQKAHHPAMGLPDKMASSIVDIREIGGMIAVKEGLPPGCYELVIEYKFGSGRLNEPTGPVGAMAITFGGLGLRHADKPSPMTIEFDGKTARRSEVEAAPAKKVAKKVTKKTVKKASSVVLRN